MKTKSGTILVFIAVSMLLILSCSPITQFYKMITGSEEQEYDPRDPFAPTPVPSKVYTGTFTGREEGWRFVEGNIELTIKQDSGKVTGTGREVFVDDPEFYDDSSVTYTYEFTFTGWCDLDSGTITGDVTIHQTYICTANCEGVDDVDDSFPTTWTGTLSDDRKSLWGTVESMGNTGKFEAQLSDQ